MSIAAKFQLQGGRAGFARFRENGAEGELEWEMLAGEIDLVIVPGSCSWRAPRENRMRADEIRRLAQELATEKRMTIDIAFPEGLMSCDLLQPDQAS
jgi:hypothetical protein